jgi:hypothetical protein
MNKCSDCSKKIPLAFAVSIAKCSCNKLFCTLHKTLHAETCEIHQKKTKDEFEFLSSKLMNGRTVENGKLVDRI